MASWRRRLFGNGDLYPAMLDKGANEIVRVLPRLSALTPVLVVGVLTDVLDVVADVLLTLGEPHGPAQNSFTD